jgi:hypothetical protein
MISSSAKIYVVDSFETCYQPAILHGVTTQKTLLFTSKTVQKILQGLDIDILDIHGDKMLNGCIG